MKRKLVSVVLSVAMSAVLLAGCGQSSGDSGTAGAGNDAADAGDTGNDAADAGDAAAGGSGDEEAEIYMFVSQPEYADAINALIAEYKTVKPNVTINYETTQNDYPVLLKAKLNSGDVPDIFASTAGKEIDMYKEYSLDLAGQPMMDTMLPAVQETMTAMDGSGIYGFAIKSNFFGIVYNKDIFTEAGVDKFPETLTELEAACAKIEAAGYQPFTSGFAEWWVFKHCSMSFFGAASADAKDLVAKFEKGEAKMADYPLLNENIFRYLDIVTKYGGGKPLETDLSAEIAAFANGQAAMVNGQGAWVEADILKINPDINIGFNGYPVSEDPSQCQVVTGADQAMRVSNSSEHQQAVLDFVNWWYTSDYGTAWFTDVAGVVPPITTTGESDFEIIKQGNALVEEKGSGPLTIIYSTDSFHTAYGEAMQTYVGGQNDKETVISTIETAWQELDGQQ